MKRFGEVLNVSLVITLLIVLAYLLLKRGWWVGPTVFALGWIPLIGVWVARLSIKRLLPDMLFGAIDTGLLVIPVLIGAELFGALGAIVGGVVGDAVTDGIAGFFEGSLAEWLRQHGIEESRLPLSSALGKMSGCLLGAGIVLTVATVLRLGILVP